MSEYCNYFFVKVFFFVPKIESVLYHADQTIFSGKKFGKIFVCDRLKMNAKISKIRAKKKQKFVPT